MPSKVQPLLASLNPQIVYEKVDGGVITRISDEMQNILQRILGSGRLIKYTEISNIWTNLKGNGEVQFIPTVEENPSKFLAGFTQMSSNTVERIILTPELFQERDKNGGFESIVPHAHKQLDAVERQAKGEIALASMGLALALFEMRLKDEEEACKQRMSKMRFVLQSGNLYRYLQLIENIINKIIDDKILPLAADILEQVFEGYTLYPSIKWQEIYKKITLITNSFLNNILDEELNLIEEGDFFDFISKYSQRSLRKTQETQ